MMELKIEYRSISKLVPYARNARLHSPAQVDEIAGSIERFGFVNPVLIGEDGVLIAGHGRILAAKQLSMDRVPTITLTGLSDTQRRALALADNRIAMNSGWDTELLRQEIEALQEGDEDILGLGFDSKELDSLMDDGDPLKVSEVNTDTVTDRFWISVRGPLKDQAKALKRLEELMAEMPEVEVELGTIAVEP